MYIKKSALSLSIFLSTLSCLSQTTQKENFNGVVVDAQTNEPMAYVYIYMPDYGDGTITDLKGEFTLIVKNLLPTKNKIIASFVGYKSEIIYLSKNSENIVIKMDPAVQVLQEVVVRKQKYQNKNNPAVDLIEKVIANKKQNSIEALDYFENEKYEKVQFAINNITEEYQKKKIFRQFQFVFENIDSVKNDGKKILPIYLKEQISSYSYQHSTHKVKEDIIAHKVVTIPGVDNKGIEENIKYLYQDINIYNENILLVSNQFLSPIASSATTFYRYYIVDTIKSAGEKYTRMYFSSRNKNDFLFQGYLYITTDGRYAIKRVEMSVNKDINLNWVNDIKIIQEFEMIENSYLMLSTDQTSVNFGINKKSRGLFGQKYVKYTNYRLTAPENEKLLSEVKKAKITDSMMYRSKQYWERTRPIPLSKSEAGTYTAMDSILNDPTFKRIRNVASLLLFGYTDLGKFEIGPVNTFYMYNPIEGFRLRFGGRTTYEFNKRFSLETYGAYGFTDQRFKYYLGGTWSFMRRDIMQFPAKNLKISIQHETQLPGQQMKFLMEDNFLLSIKRGVNDKIFYNKTLTIENLNEFNNNFSYALGYRFTNQSPGGKLYFNYTDYLSQYNDVNSLSISEFYINLRYAPHEKFYQGKTYRVPIMGKYPVFELRYIAGSKAWGNDYNYQNLRFSVRKRFYFSVLGYSDISLGGGKIFGKVPYQLLNIPQANQSYSYQIESYNMMNFLEFVTDQYMSLLIDHSFNGFFLNKIPVINGLKLREVITLKALYGNVTKTNDPSLQPDLFRLPIETNGTPNTYTLGKTPYIEGSIGVSNIFKFFRVDLVRRYTYLDNPNVSEYGIRMRFRFDF